jgi:hypothetical protein
VQPGLLKRRFGGRPVLRHAEERTVAVVHDEIDVELDAVEVLLDQEVAAGAEPAR